MLLNAYTVTIFHKSISISEPDQCKITAQYCCRGYIRLSVLRVKCNVLAVSNPIWLPAKISIFFCKTRGRKSQLVCTDFYLLKGSRYRLTSAWYLILTSLEMGTGCTFINDCKDICLFFTGMSEHSIMLLRWNKKGRRRECIAFGGNI